MGHFVEIGSYLFCMTNTIIKAEKVNLQTKFYNANQL